MNLFQWPTFLLEEVGTFLEMRDISRIVECLNDEQCLYILLPLIRSMVRTSPLSLKHFPDLAADKKYVYELMRINGFALPFASTECRDDKEIVIAAMLNCHNRRNIVYQTIVETKVPSKEQLALFRKIRCHCAHLLKYVSMKLRSDKHIVMLAVNNDGMAIQYACESFCDDRDVVMTAVRSNGMSLMYASASLREDNMVVLAAILENGLALKFASKTLQSVRTVVRTAMSQNHMAICFGSDDLWNEFRRNGNLSQL